MAKRVFTEEERVEYREKMLAAGFDLLKQYGMTHMSVAKITEAAYEETMERMRDLILYEIFGRTE